MSNLVAFSERQSEYCEMLQASFRPNQALQWRTELQENHRLLRELERFLAQQLFHKDFLQSLLPAAAVRHQKKQNICPNCMWQKRNVGNKINSIWLFPKPLLHQNYSVNAGFLKVGSQNPRRVCVSHSPSRTRWNNRKLQIVSSDYIQKSLN